MAKETIAGLIERFGNLPDPRVEGRTDHDVLDIIVLALYAVMSGAEGWDDIEDLGLAREEWLRRYLNLRNGIPGHETIRRIFEALSPNELEQRFEQWMSAVCPAVAGRVIAIDGKALRGPARAGRGLRQVSAYAADYGLTLGQRVCEEKSNEIIAIADLLPVLALEGAVVTITTEQRYVISSLPANSRRILHAVRTHWGIENGLHWCLDVTFGEDASSIRLRNAALNFSFLRRVSLNLFRGDTSRSTSLPRKRKAAAWNPDCLAAVLQLREI